MHESEPKEPSAQSDGVEFHLGFACCARPPRCTHGTAHERHSVPEAARHFPQVLPTRRCDCGDWAACQRTWRAADTAAESFCAPYPCHTHTRQHQPLCAPTTVQRRSCITRACARCVARTRSRTRHTYTCRSATHSKAATEGACAKVCRVEEGSRTELWIPSFGRHRQQRAEGAHRAAQSRGHSLACSVANAHCCRYVFVLFVFFVWFWLVCAILYW